MSDSDTLRLLRRALECLSKDPANRGALLHMTRVVHALADVCLAAAADPDARRTAPAKLAGATAALTGEQLQTTARRDLLYAIDDAIRLRDSLNACARGAYPEELEPAPRDGYARDLVREVLEIERGNDLEQGRALTGGSPGLLLEWPEQAMRAMREPEHMALETFAVTWPEYAERLTAADVKRVVEIWQQSQGRPRADDKTFARKWPIVATLMAQAGLITEAGRAAEISLKSAWSRWSNGNPGDPWDSEGDEGDDIEW